MFRFDDYKKIQSSISNFIQPLKDKLKTNDTQNTIMNIEKLYDILHFKKNLNMCYVKYKRYLLAKILFYFFSFILNIFTLILML